MSTQGDRPGWWLASDGKWYPPAGWWQASDGNWYPPELAPAAAPASLTPPASCATPASLTPPPSIAPPPSPAHADLPPSWGGTATPSPVASESTPDIRSAVRGSAWTATAYEQPFSATATPGWETSIGGGERKGLRTERSAGNYFLRSLVMAVLYCGFLALVLATPDKWWMLIGAPILLGFRYIFPSKRGPGLLAEVRRRVGYADVGIGWARESRRGVFLLRAAAVLAVLGFACGMAGNVVFWDRQLGGGSKGGGNPLSTVANLTHPTTSTTLVGSNPDENQLQQLQNTQQQQQKTIDSLVSGGG